MKKKNIKVCSCHGKPGNPWNLQFIVMSMDDDVWYGCNELFQSFFNVYHDYVLYMASRSVSPLS